MTTNETAPALHITIAAMRRLSNGEKASVFLQAGKYRQRGDEPNEALAKAFAEAPLPRLDIEW